MIAKGFMLLLAGIPVYVWLKWRQSRAPAPEPEPVPRRLVEPRVRQTPVGTL